MSADVITFPVRAKPAAGIPRLSGIPELRHRVSDLIAAHAPGMKGGDRETLAGLILDYGGLKLSRLILEVDDEPL